MKNNTDEKITYHLLPALFDRLVKLSVELETKQRKFGTDVFLSSTEIHMTELVGEREGLSITEIAKINRVTKGAVSQTLKKLQNKGLIYKEKDPLNISRYKVFLTNKGKTAYYSHKHWHDKMDGGYKEYFESMDQEKLNFLYQSLKRVESFLEHVLKAKE